MNPILEAFFDELEKIAFKIPKMPDNLRKTLAYSAGGAAAGAAGGALVGMPGHRKERAFTGAIAGALGAPISMTVRDAVMREGAFKALEHVAK
jgi:hypothetical protein